MSLPRFTKFQLLVHAGAWLPLLLLIWDAFAGNLSFNPIQDITLRTGKTALVLLVLSLAATPANTLFGFRQAIKVRRPLGVYAFMYAVLHLAIFVGLDYGFDFRIIWLELVEKRYVLAGFAAFLILLPLALTSTKGWQKRLGRRWKSLHKWVYLAGVLVAVHFIWLDKDHAGEPVFWAAGIALLLIARIKPVRQALVRARRRLPSFSRSRFLARFSTPPAQ